MSAGEQGVARHGATATTSSVTSCGENDWPFRTQVGRLALPPKRVRLWAAAIALLGLVPIDTALVNGGGDWSVFWSAGATVGTAALLDPNRHTAWQLAHGVARDYWRYPPAFAYVFAPYSWLPIWLGFVVQAILMVALVAVAGLLLSRIFDLPQDVGLLLAFAWTPATAALDIGQNAPLATALALWTLDALRRDSDLEAGLAAGILLYKPTVGLPILAFLFLRRRWRAAIVGAVAIAAWYLASVVATAGDWSWPADWWNWLQPWLAADMIRNADKAVSIPGLLGRIPGLPEWLAYASAAAIVAMALRGLVRAPIVEAASAACLVGLVAGPRVWGYEAGLALPILAWAVADGLAELWRTRLIFAAVPLGLLWLVSPYTQLSGVAVILAVTLGLWLWRWRPLGPAPAMAQAAA
jgi:hypothetical protein